MRILFSLLVTVAVSAWAQGLPLGGIPIVVSGGTTPAYVDGCNVSANAQVVNCVWQGTKPSAGKALFGVIWVGTTGSVTSVCDGDTNSGDATGCTGSSIYKGTTGVDATFPPYTNTGYFRSIAFYTCNFAGYTGSNAQLTVTLDSSRNSYMATAIVAAASTTACNGGYNHAQALSGANSPVSGTVNDTTNAHDLMVGLMTNSCGGTAYTAGQDGQGHTYTSRQQNNGVVLLETLSESATGTYYAAATGPSCTLGWNAEVFAVK